MRILHIATMLPEETTPGGGASCPLEIARAQADLGHDVEIWGIGTRGPWLRRERHGRLRVFHERPVKIRPFHGSDPLYIRCLVRMAFGKRADIAHFHQYKILQWRWLIPLAKWRGMKVCLTDHGGGGWRNLPVRIGHRVDKFLLYSEYNSRFFLKGNEEMFRTDHETWETDHNYPGSPDRIVVIGGGVDDRLFVPRPGPPDRPPYLLFVGRIARHKGIEFAIRALGRLRERHPDLALKIVGPESRKHKYRQELEEESKRAGVQDRVAFLGYRAGAELVRLYQGASAFVLPSTYRPSDGRLLHKPELFGLVLLEAMACGVPTICSRVGGMVESVRDGETGLVFDDQDDRGLADCIDRVLTDATLRERLVGNASRMVKAEYTWPRVAEKCLRAYEQLLAR